MNFKKIIFLLLLVIFDFWFSFRYITFGIDIANILKAMLFINIAFSVSFLSYGKLQNLFNPFSVYSIFIFLFGFSYINISGNQSPKYNWLTELIVIFSIISFLLGATVASRKSIRLNSFAFNSTLRYFFLLSITAISFGVFLLEIKNIGYFPVLNLGGDIDIYNDANESLISFGHYFVLYIAFIPAILYIFFKNGIISFKTLILLSVISIFVCLNFFSRQNILLLLISFFLSYNYFNKISTLKILLTLACIPLIFYFIGNIRLGHIENLEINEYLKSYANIDKDVSTLETYITLYSSQNFTTLDNLVLKLSLSSEYTFGASIFHPIISLFYLDRLNIVSYNESYNSFKMLGTYVFEPFLDFNLLGVIIFNSLIGFFSMKVYFPFVQKKGALSILNLSIIYFCILMSSFTNFYITFFIWMSLFLNYFLLNNLRLSKP